MLEVISYRTTDVITQNMETEMDTHYISTDGAARQDTLHTHAFISVRSAFGVRSRFTCSVSTSTVRKDILTKYPYKESCFDYSMFTLQKN